MKKEELLKELAKEETYNDGTMDIEKTHIKADELLLKFINDPEVTEVFNKICKWYA